MHFIGEILDDLLRDLYSELLRKTGLINTSRGNTYEIVGVLLQLKCPRARLSRTEVRGKPFSCLGELLWYLARDNTLDFIGYYIGGYEKESEDGITVYGAYGPRLFSQRGHNQIQNVISLLSKNSTSRRAVIQLFNAEDIDQQVQRHVEIPCTTTLQFVVRDNLLHMLTTMRSNDAYKGLPHDVFCFTMLQEIVARSLGIDVGEYRHFAGSMHFYESDRENVLRYIEEAYQSSVEMPSMPAGDQWASIAKVLEAERRIRSGEDVSAESFGVDKYWEDIIRLIQVFESTGDPIRIGKLKSEMFFKCYSLYIEGRGAMAPRTIRLPRQPALKL